MMFMSRIRSVIAWIVVSAFMHNVSRLCCVFHAVVAFHCSYLTFGPLQCLLKRLVRLLFLLRVVAASNDMSA